MQPLESRRLLAARLHNANLPLDVNDDFQVTASDALAVINWLASDDGSPDNRPHRGYWPDVDANGQVTARDALRIINALPDADPLPRMRLVCDTAAAGTTNRDSLTSDLTIEGRLSPRESPINLHLVVESVSREGFNRPIDLTAFIDGDRFVVPHRTVASLIVPTVRSDEAVDATIALVRNGQPPDGPYHGRVLSRLSVRFDNRAPTVLLPTRFAPGDRTLSVTVVDSSPLTGSATRLGPVGGCRLADVLNDRGQ